MLPLSMLLLTLLTLTTAAPIPDKTEEYTGPVITRAAAPAIVTKIENPEPVPGTILLVPPPLFDPSEPRPSPLFESAKSDNSVQSTLRAPPIQEQRHETLLPFDGAHVHPFTTPYTPENLPGTCAFDPRCRIARTSAEISITLVVLCSVVYAVIYLIDKIIRKLIWTAKTRARSPSGILRLEPELGNRLAESQQLESDTAYKNPLVKVWCEKGFEKVIFPG